MEVLQLMRYISNYNCAYLELGEYGYEVNFLDNYLLESEVRDAPRSPPRQSRFAAAATAADVEADDAAEWVPPRQSKMQVYKKKQQCCGAGVGAAGAEMILRIRSRSRNYLFLNTDCTKVRLEAARMNKNSFLPTLRHIFCYYSYRTF